MTVAACLPVAAHACTVCESETGQQVRAGIFDDRFWTTLAAVAAPFPVLLLAIAAIHLALPSSPKTNRETPNP